MAKLDPKQLTRVRAAAAKEAKANADATTAATAAEAERDARAYEIYRQSRATARKDPKAERLSWPDALARAAGQIAEGGLRKAEVESPAQGGNETTAETTANS